MKKRKEKKENRNLTGQEKSQVFRDEENQNTNRPFFGSLKIHSRWYVDDRLLFSYVLQKLLYRLEVFPIDCIFLYNSRSFIFVMPASQRSESKDYYNQGSAEATQVTAVALKKLAQVRNLSRLYLRSKGVLGFH